MTAKTPATVVDDLVRLYRAGTPNKEIQRKLGISSTTILVHLRERGVTPAKRPPRPKGSGSRFNADLPIEEIAARYTAGESSNALAKAYGVSRSVIDRRLDMAGVDRRGIDEANRRMMAERTPEENRRNSDAAHDAARGSTQTWEAKCKTAQGRERRKNHVSPAESLLARWLADRGLESVPQKAVGPYNCDLAVESVAVEIFGGGWHAHGHHRRRAAERTRYFLDQGWLMVMIWVDGRRHPLTEGAADYVSATVEIARRDPSFRGEYRVIWGGGELYARGRDQLDEIALKPSFTGRRRGRPAD